VALLHTTYVKWCRCAFCAKVRAGARRSVALASAAVAVGARDERRGFSLIWTPAAQNRKTGRVPTAYVGVTRDETRESCEGCALRDSRRCYAWSGPQGQLGLSKIHKGYRVRGERFYTLAHALKHRQPDARVVRVASIGDPARADRVELLASLLVVRRAGLGVVGYSHFWGDPWNSHLRRELMASCDDLEQADEAIAAGWRAAAVLPWDHEGLTFSTPAGARGVVCPAQTKPAVTCNTCGMCDPRHRVWAAGKVKAIGFLDHSRAAVRAARERGRRLPTAGVAGALAPVGW